MDNVIEEYLKKPYTICIQHYVKEKVYLVEVKEFPGCITYGETLQEAWNMAMDAMKAWIMTALLRGKEIPEPDNSEHEN